MKARLTLLPWILLVALGSGCNMESGRRKSSDFVRDFSADPSEGVYCPAVEQRVRPADCEDLTRADAEVRQGAAAFNVPDPMRRGETFDVHLVIDRRPARKIRIIDPPRPGGPAASNVSAGDDGNQADDPAVKSAPPDSDGPNAGNSAADFEDDAPTPGQIVDPLEGKAERFYPKVGRHMRAELIGQGFEIVARSEASQQIPIGGNATWVWSVTALKGGPQPLTLVTIVEGVADGRRFVLARTPTVRTVTVEVSLGDRIWDTLNAAPAWIKAVTAVIAAVGGLLTAWYALPWWRRRKARGHGPDKTDGPGGGEE